MPGKLWDSVIATIRNAIKGTYTAACIMHFKRNVINDKFGIRLECPKVGSDGII